MDRTALGLINGMIGVVIFSGSLPATRLAVMDLDPVFLTVARAAIAGVLALGLLMAFREKRPAGESRAEAGEVHVTGHVDVHEMEGGGRAPKSFAYPSGTRVPAVLAGAGARGARVDAEP